VQGSATPTPFTALERKLPVLALATFATATQSFVFAGLLNEMAAELGIGIGQAGQLGTAFAVAFALAAPGLAAITARLPRRGLMVGALLGIAAINLGLALAPGFGSLLALRILAGVVGSLVVPAASSVAVRIAAPERRGRALAIIVSGTTAAFLLGIPAGSVVGGWFGWRASFVLAAGAALLAALSMAALLPAIAGADQGGKAGLAVIRRPAVRRSLLLTFLAFTAVFCLSAYIGPVTNQVSDLHGAGVAVFQAMVGVASLAGVPIGGRLADRRVKGAPVVLFGVIGLGLALQAVLLRGALLPGSSLAIGLQLFAVLLTAAGLFALTPLIQGGLVEAAGEARGVALAFNGSALFLGQAGGAALGGAAISLGGLQFTALAGLAVAVGGAMVAARRS